jgi:hypothetical protein
MTFPLMLAAAHGGHAATVAHGSASIEPWQLINLVGAPLLALMFAGPVVDDVRNWIVSLRERPPASGNGS